MELRASSKREGAQRAQPGIRLELLMRQEGIWGIGGTGCVVCFDCVDCDESWFVPEGEVVLAVALGVVVWEK
jgi:hypothetical protein